MYKHQMLAALRTLKYLLAGLHSRLQLLDGLLCLGNDGLLILQSALADHDVSILLLDVAFDVLLFPSPGQSPFPDRP